MDVIVANCDVAIAPNMAASIGEKEIVNALPATGANINLINNKDETLVYHRS